ncbi:unnamed protein product, partial [Ectocarpus sp. 12 AP-2014]
AHFHSPRSVSSSVLIVCPEQEPAYNTSTHKYTSALPLTPNLFFRACWSGCPEREVSGSATYVLHRDGADRK